MYCKAFELSSCGEKICCNECNNLGCNERCTYHENDCGDSTENVPLSFEEMMEL